MEINNELFEDLARLEIISTINDESETLLEICISLKTTQSNSTTIGARTCTPPPFFNINLKCIAPHAVDLATSSYVLRSSYVEL